MAVATLALAAGCGGDSGDPATPGAQTTLVPSTAPPLRAERSAEVVTNDGARLRITLAVGGAPVAGQAEACATGSPVAPATVPVTLTVVNLGDRTAPFPPLRLETTAAGGVEERTLVRAGAGECSPFPRVAPLGPGQTAVFTGSTPAGGGRIEVRISETDFVLPVTRP